MNPIAFSVFGLDIRWYGLLISVAMIVGVTLAIKESERIGLNSEIITDLFLWILPAAIIGARLYYVLFEWGYYREHYSEIFAIRNGGLAIHGGVIASLIVGYVFLKKKDINFWTVADIVAPSLILGQAIGRWGNFINQEAHGGMVSKEFISYFPTFIQKQMYIEGQYYHPTFLYESVSNFLIFAFLIFYRGKKKKKDGEIIALYAILYSIVRFFIEGLRTDSLMLGKLRIAQVVSLILLLIGTVIFCVRRTNSKVS